MKNEKPQLRDTEVRATPPHSSLRSHHSALSSSPRPIFWILAAVVLCAVVAMVGDAMKVRSEECGVRSEKVQGCEKNKPGRARIDDAAAPSPTGRSSGLPGRWPSIRIVEEDNASQIVDNGDNSAQSWQFAEGDPSPRSPEAQKPSRSFEPKIFSQLRNHKSKEVPECVKNLAAEVTKDCTNNVTKARAIYNWITENIKYDTVEWKNIVSGADDYTHEHDPATVLERGNTVCIGYAWLFDDMCSAAGIESTFIIGDVRGYRGTEDDDLVSKIKHAWSAVKDEDGWKLLDATWGARQEGESEADTKERADYYYGTPADQFVYDHLPENEEWQLLDPTVPSLGAFKVLPNLKPAFFINGLTLGSNYSSVLAGESGKRYRMVFGKPESTDVAFTIGPTSDGEKSAQLRTINSASGKASAVVLPELPAGEHLLRVYSRKGEGAYSCAADFVIRIE